jgi:hypothetical protein
MDETEYTKIDPELKRRWVEALWSGQYEQGSGTLRATTWHDDGLLTTHCCLGVFCDLLDPTGWNDTRAYGDAEDESHPNWHSNKSAILGPMYSASGELLLNEHTMRVLASMNDGSRPGFSLDPLPKHSFPEIADWIEENL